MYYEKYLKCHVHRIDYCGQLWLFKGLTYKNVHFVVNFLIMSANLPYPFYAP
jgi:hypothetical protein